MKSVQRSCRIFYWKTGFVLLSIIVLSAPLFALSDRPNFEVDAANFSSQNPRLSRLDLFIKVEYHQVQFIKSASSRFLAEYEVVVEVFDERNEKVDGKILKETILTDEVADIKSIDKFKLSKASFDLTPGTYKALITLQDLETREKTTRTLSLRLKDYTDPANLASDILILDDYSKDESGRLIFYPRVSRAKREGAKLYAYFEVYNVAANDSFEVSFAVTDAAKQPLWSDAFVRNGAGPVTQNFIVIEGDSLQHGQYFVKLRIKYRDRSLDVEKTFDWLIEDLPPSIATLDEAVEVLKYLVPTDAEYERLKSLKPAEKYRAFLAFWKKRDPTPETPANERRSQYYKRVDYANNRFGKLGKDGWKTEMGWVYVLLGPPDSIERDPYSVGIRNDGRSVKSVQIWVYFDHNRQLIFYDANGYGDYRLENFEDFYEMLKYVR